MNEYLGNSEEQLKAIQNSPREAAHRNGLHLQTLYNETEGPNELKAFLEEGFFNPVERDLAEVEQGLTNVLKKTAVVVPCFEPQEEKVEAVLETARTLTSRVKAHNVIYFVSALHERALIGLKELGVHIIFENDVRKKCDWSALGSIINLHPNDPRGLSQELRGKGTTILFGLAGLHISRPELFEEMDWVVLCDAEIQMFERYQMLEHLMYPAALASQNDVNCQFQQLVQAKIGRGNEGLCMALNMLKLLIDCGAPKKVADAAEFVYHSIAPMVWYGCGERAIRANLLPSLAIGGGYSLEVVFDMGIPRRLDQNICLVGQTSNSNPRIDGANSVKKEWLMWDQIAKILHVFALNGIIVPKLETLADFARVNQEVLSQGPIGTTLMLPEEYGKPVQTLSYRFPRIYPPINLLLKNNIITP